MKTISDALQAHVEDGGPIATLVKIERSDGITLGFTGWDALINYDGLIYWPTVGLQPSAVKANSDLTTDQMDIIGVIDSTLITEEDIDAGRYDLAKFTVMLVNPADLSMGVRVDLYGPPGDVTYGEGMLQIALNSLGAYCNQQFGDVVTPVCRVKQLGDSQCKVNIASYQFSHTVVSITDARTIVFDDGTHATGYYSYGMVRFKSIGSGGGANHDLSMEVKTHTLTGGQAVIVLQEPMPFPVNPGDTVILEAGCDRRGITCRNKFANLVNIHAEPYVPGNNYLLTTGRPPSS